VGSLPQPAPLVPVEVDLSRFSEAAWIIDLDQARVTAASRSGRAIWGGAWREGTFLDRAMPAFAELYRIATTAGFAGGDQQRSGAEKEQRLLIWTTQGIVKLRCRCQPLAHDTRKVLVVAADGAREIDSDRPANNSSGGVSDKGRAMLAHELRTPLSAIVALAEVMKDERFGPVGNKRYLVYANDIYESARHGLSVLGAMLEGGGSESTAPQPAQTDVNETVSRCLSALRELAGKASVRLVADLGPDQWRLAIERRSLMQILLNLISNALKFTSPGGEITVATRNSPDGGLILSVSDTGAGMTRDQLERIRSGEFASAGIGSPRSGYGLPIVAALARGSGGRMEIDSAPGQGTRVSITFPSDRLVGTGSPLA
jgi:signal transduction histidine kinase